MCGPAPGACLVGRECHCCSWRKSRGLPSHHCQLKDLIGTSYGAKWGPGDDPARRVAHHTSQEFHDWVGAHNLPKLKHTGESNDVTRVYAPPPVAAPSLPLGAPLAPDLGVRGPLSQRGSRQYRGCHSSGSDRSWRQWSGEDCAEWMVEVCKLPQYYLTAKQNLSGRLLERVTASVLPNLGIHDLEAQRVVLHHVRELVAGETSWQPQHIIINPPLSAQPSRKRPGIMQSFGISDEVSDGIAGLALGNKTVHKLPTLMAEPPQLDSQPANVKRDATSGRSLKSLTPKGSARRAVSPGQSGDRRVFKRAFSKHSKHVQDLIGAVSCDMERPSLRRISGSFHISRSGAFFSPRDTCGQEGSCARCGWLQEQLVKSSDCPHRLCRNCSFTATRVGPWDANVVTGSEKLVQTRECPICSRPWTTLSNPKGLVSLCIEHIRKRAAKLPADGIMRIPPKLRTKILADDMSLSPLGLNRIKAWVADTSVETLNLAGLFAESLKGVAPIFPETLTTLVLSSVNLSDELLSFILSHCGKNLRTLQCDLMQDSADESRLQGIALATAPQLQAIDLGYQRKLLPSSLVALADASGSRLVSVKIGGCMLTNDDVLMSLTACNLLDTLDISCTAVTSAAVEQVLTACPFIRALNISDCFKIDGDEVFQVCAMSAVNLEEFEAAGLKDLTDSGLRDLLDSPISPHFRILNLSRNSEISDASVHLISRHCKALQVLDLDMCVAIGLKTLQRLIIELPRVEVFPLRMIRDTQAKSQLTYILRSRGHDNSVEFRPHEPEESALQRFLTQNETTGGADYVGMQAKSTADFNERLKEAMPNYRDPAVVEFYQAPRRRNAYGARRGLWKRPDFTATKRLHKWLDEHTHDPLDEKALAQLRHLVLRKPSLGIFKGTSALHCLLRNNVADYNGISSAIQFLVEQHSNPDIAESKHGLTPLLYACCLQFPDGVRTLLEVTRGSSPTLQRQDNSLLQGYNLGSTLTMMQKVRRGEPFETLADDTNVAARDRSGMQPVHIAAASGNVIGFRTLIELKANPNSLDTCGRSPLWWACRMGHCTVIEELLNDERTNLSIPSLPVGGLPESSPILVAMICGHPHAANMVRTAVGARQWPDLEAEIQNAHLLIKDKPAKACSRWLQHAFGPMASNRTWSEISAIDCNGRVVPPRLDKWQLRAVLAEAGPAQASERGRIMVERLLVPLMQLAADLALKGPPKVLLDYLFHQAVPSYGLDKLMDTSEHVLATLGKLGDKMYAALKMLPKLHHHLDGIADTTDQLLHQGASWGGVHQAFAHGSLPWLEKDRESCMGAAHALYENGALTTVEDMVEWVGSLGSRNLLLLRFWACVYDIWLVGEARRVDSMAQQMMRDIRDALPREIRERVQVHAGPIKKLKRVQQKKVEYGSLAPVVAAQEEAGEPNSEDYIAYLHEVSAGHGNLQDRMAAGGICDLVRATVECDDEEAVIEVCKVALARRRAEHGLEAVRIKNGFHKKIPAGSYRDIKILFLIQGQDKSGRPYRHIIECQVLLRDFLALKSCQHAAYRVVRGEFGRVTAPGKVDESKE